MVNISLKQQAVPLVILGVLLLIAAVTAVGDQPLKQERKAFSIEHYERLMHRIDVAVGSISDTMVEEGMAADFEELFRRDKSETGTPAGRAVPTVSIEDAPRVALTLTGIIWHEKAPLAFVNDTLVGVGDHVGDAELVRIEKARVVVRHRDGQKRVLELVDADER